uniref:Uncharacterized protein n=1 Tax=Rhizophora mucronata TaxID=61149 RepID=A0A2P2JGC6_RHIMU
MERLRECMEELLEFTLKSHVNETLEFDLGLSKYFCSKLLELGQNDAVSNLVTATDAGRDFECCTF